MLLLTTQIMLKHSITSFFKTKRTINLITLMLLRKFSSLLKLMTGSLLIIIIEATYTRNFKDTIKHMRAMIKLFLLSQKMLDIYIRKDLLMSFNQIRRVYETLYKCLREHFKQILITLLQGFIQGKCFIKISILMMRFNVSQQFLSILI